MRFSILLIALALLPMMVIFHGWFFTEQQMPRLRDQAEAVLKQNGIRSAAVNLRYLDLKITGDAPDLRSLESALSGVRDLGPLRLVKDELRILARLRARMEAGRLLLEGWLPDPENLTETRQLFSKLRPDLTLDIESLLAHERVRWPEGEKGPLTADSSLLKPIIEKLRVAPHLDIRREAEKITVAGMVPAGGFRQSLLAALSQCLGTSTLDSSALKESTHTLPAGFVDGSAMGPFVRSFFAKPSPRHFSVSPQGTPHLEAPATHSDESTWLALLRPLSGGQKVDMKLTLYPSEYHFPGFKPTSPVPLETLAVLKDSLTGQGILFEAGSTRISPEDQSRLAGITPLLLIAGPALRLVVGGHPAPEGQAAVEKALALARAEQVVSFLIEQGVPTTDIQAVALDPVPAGTPGAPEQTQSVEILIR